MPKSGKEHEKYQGQGPLTIQLLFLSELMHCIISIIIEKRKASVSLRNNILYYIIIEKYLVKSSKKNKKKT